jgi:hypothetical protein
VFGGGLLHEQLTTADSKITQAVLSFKNLPTYTSSIFDVDGLTNTLLVRVIANDLMGEEITSQVKEITIVPAFSATDVSVDHDTIVTSGTGGAATISMQLNGDAN